jgi:hypothetical protein
MQIKFRRASLAGPSDSSSAATRPIANIIQGANVIADAVITHSTPP